MGTFTEAMIDQDTSTSRTEAEAPFTNRLRIAYCLPDQKWIEEVRGGRPRDAAHLQQKFIVDGLLARGHSITFVAPRDLELTAYARNTEALSTASQTWTAGRWFVLFSKITWRIQQAFGIPYLNFFSNLRREDAYRQILRGHDMVFERNSLYNAGAARASRRLGLPFIMFFDADQIAELEFMGKPLTGWLLWRARHLLRENLRAARLIICVSTAAREHLITRWGIPGQQILVLPNAVDVQRFRPDPSLRGEKRESLELSRNPLLVFVGSFYQWHDIRILLDAFARVLISHAEARLILVGDGAGCGEMMKHAADLGIDQYVLFTGFLPQEEVAHYVNAADIAVVPVPVMRQTLWLSPMKLFEYMASGKAVVASAMGQIAEMVRDGENGLLVPAGDVKALAGAINRLIADPDLRERLGKQAREDAVRHHSWDSYISRLERIFETLINHRSAANPQAPITDPL